MTKTVKSVSFNDKNEKDKQMLKHISRRNFSGYVKKLIEQDIKTREDKKTHTEQSGQNEGVIKPPKKNIYEIAKEKKENPPKKASVSKPFNPPLLVQAYKKTNSKT